MRALPEILKRRPNARILIVGGDGKEGPSYGAVPVGGGSWKEIFKSEISSSVAEEDWARVHYLGKIPYEYFTKLLQLSTVHVYLTYPFILSWSLLEAMSVGCSIVASATPPVLEVIRDNETGRVFDFFDVHGLAEQVCELLDDEARRNILGREARDFARSKYDLRTVCLPKQISWIEDIA
jgi:glycosyltransferase involved in cell wall biosynthesis